MHFWQKVLLILVWKIALMEIFGDPKSFSSFWAWKKILNWENVLNFILQIKWQFTKIPILLKVSYAAVTWKGFFKWIGLNLFIYCWPSLYAHLHSYFAFIKKIPAHYQLILLGPKNVQFGKSHFKDQNIDAQMFLPIRKILT